MVTKNTDIIMVIRMTEANSVVQLMTWLSPAFPVGGFSYSSGLEYAVDQNLVSDRQALVEWLATQLEHGSLWNDAVFVSLGWKYSDAGEKLSEINMLALAMAGSAGRYLEVSAQGHAFLEAAELENLALDPAVEVAYPVVIGAVAGLAGINEAMTIAAFLNSVVTNQMQAAIRLGAIGQKSGVKLIADLQSVILDCSQKASGADTSELGGCAMLAEISAMNQETLTTKLFRS